MPASCPSDGSARLKTLFLFGEIPDGWAMLGAAIVIAATLAITLREARLKKAAPPPIDQ